jgi:AcrR family transcriptional regulator
MSERRDAILDAAIGIADEKGLDAVSMRAVADRVGLTPMALYPHVGNKAALLDGMLGKMLGQLGEVSAAGASWQDRLSHLAHAGRSLSQRHPWLATLQFVQAATAPSATRVTDSIYQALLEAGVPDADVPRLERMLGTFILGYGASEALGRFGDAQADRRRTRGKLPEGDLPGHARLAPWLNLDPDWDAEFEADLDDLGLLIAAKASGAG